MIETMPEVLIGYRVGDSADVDDDLRAKGINMV